MWFCKVSFSIRIKYSTNCDVRAKGCDKSWRQWYPTDCHHNQTTAEETLLSVEMCVTTSQKYFSSLLLITCFHIWHSPGGTHITATRHWERSNKAFYIGPSILSAKTGYKGMTQHPAAAGILYWLSCPLIGRERQALLLVNLSGSCYWVEVDATNEAVSSSNT